MELPKISLGLLIYMGIVSSVGLIILVRSLVWLGSSTRERRRRLDKRIGLEAIETNTPLKEATEIARERGMNAIETQFSVIRRLLIPIIVLLTAFALAIPFLAHVPAAVLSLLVGAITVLIGVGSRPVVENAIAGLVISFSKLFNIGDTVQINEWYGTVEDTGITHTTIKVWDWRRYVVPNSSLIQGELINYSVRDRFLWAFVDFWVSYEADWELVRKVALTAAANSPHRSPTGDIDCWVMELEKEGIRCRLAAWANNPSDAWYMRHDMRVSLLKSLRAHDIPSHLGRTSFHAESKAPRELTS